MQLIPVNNVTLKIFKAPNINISNYFIRVRLSINFLLIQQASLEYMII